MTKRLFIGSSSEAIDVALEIQAHLESHFEVTVWNQGVFKLSESTLESLLNALNNADFGVFVFTADDISVIRDETHRTVRDNVIFELGLFIGRLGKERAYFVVPKGVKDLALPSDLAGITYTSYNPDRTDGNLNAALATSCLEIRKAVNLIVDEPSGASSKQAESPEIDDDDALSLLESWMGERRPEENTAAIRYADVDLELQIPLGTTMRLIEGAAERYGYVTRRRGKETIMFAREWDP